MEIPLVNKKRSGISRGEKEKIMWNSMGLGFWFFEISMGIAQFCGISRGEAAFCLEFPRLK